MSTAARVLYVAEPPATLRARTPIVVDCSVMSAVVFDETTREEAAAQLAGHSLYAPWLLDHEIASVAVKKLRGGWSPESVEQGLRSYARHAVSKYQTELTKQVELADRYGLTSYDAAYLCVASALQAPLATFDRKLAAAATRHLGSGGPQPLP